MMVSKCQAFLTSFRRKNSTIIQQFKLAFFTEFPRKVSYPKSMKYLIYGVTKGRGEGLRQTIATKILLRGGIKS
jgi:hypothetical protein